MLKRSFIKTNVFIKTIFSIYLPSGAGAEEAAEDPEAPEGNFHDDAASGMCTMYRKTFFMSCVITSSSYTIITHYNQF